MLKERRREKKKRSGEGELGQEEITVTIVNMYRSVTQKGTECGGTRSWLHLQSQNEPYDINQLYHRDSDKFKRW